MSEEQQNQTQPGGQPGTTDQKFTQADLDRIVTERLARERAKYADYDEVKRKLQAIEEAEKTELDRAKEEAQKLKAERDAAVAQAQDRLVQAAFIAAAAQVGAAHPEDAFRLADLAGVSVQEDGTVTGAAEAVKALADAGRLPLATRHAAPQLDGGRGSGQGPAGQQPTLSPEELAIAQRLGIKPDDYLKHKRRE